MEAIGIGIALIAGVLAYWVKVRTEQAKRDEDRFMERRREFNEFAELVRRHQNEMLGELPEDEKHKRVMLTDDGELVDFPEEKPKRYEY